ncbi:MAG: transglycosylase domain-containing protein [Eubacteriales bacterium]|nr:transglycosylase domain-containing protein [Eubacteriales bacterium]
MAKKKKGILFRVLRFFLISGAVSLILLTVSAVFIYKKLSADIDFDKDRELFEMAKGSKTTRFYYDSAKGADAFGVYRAVEMEDERAYDSENSIWISSSQIPDNMKNAFIAIEDHRFYEHKGVDVLRTVKAAANYFLHFDSRFGGSTITQQLIKNISSDNEISARRKANEILRALEIEKNYTKDDILELYLNIVPLSQGCAGVGSAANKYFNRDVSELSLAECASLAAITNSPSKYDLIKHPENNKERRDIILAEMKKYGYINDEEYNSAISENVCAVISDKEESVRTNSWYTDMVIDDVISDLSEKLDINSETATKLVYSGGLKIYTLMDRDVQNTLDDYFSDLSHFPDAAKNDTLKYSMIVINPYNGAVLGVAGAQGDKNANRILNYATEAKRPIGSAIKPLSVYGPAIEENLITWSTVFDDVPLEFYGERAWPRNSPDVYVGLTDVATALKYSKNTVAMRVFNLVGAERAYNYLTEKLGFSSIVRSGYDSDGNRVSDMSVSPLAFGQLTYGATLRETTGAYDALLTGNHHKSRSYLAVYDNKGKALLINNNEDIRVFSDETATVMTKMLEGVVDFGTAKQITLKNVIDTAGKTGTSGNSYDKYFVGYTPYICAGIWCGFEESGRPVITSSHLKIWDDIMHKLHFKYISSSDEPKNFTIAGGVQTHIYCCDSGMLPSDACQLDARGNRERAGYYKKGTVPTQKCSCHVCVEYDKARHGIATEESLDENIEQISLIRVENRDFPKQIYITDAQYVFRDAKGKYSDNSNASFFADDIEQGHFVGISKTPDGRQFNATAKDEENQCAENQNETSESEKEEYIDDDNENEEKTYSTDEYSHEIIFDAESDKKRGRKTKK